MSKIVVHRRALRYVQRLPRPAQERLRAALVRLGDAPDDYPGIVQMAGEWSGYQRVRVGDFRVIFWHDREDDTIYIDHIGPRGDVYRRT